MSAEMSTEEKMIEQVSKAEVEPLSEALIMKALEAVIDPELHMNIVELGLVYNVTLLYAEDKARIAAAKAAEAEKKAETTDNTAAAPVELSPEDATSETKGVDQPLNLDPQAPKTGIPDIEVEMTLTSPGCPYGPMIMGQVPVTLKNEFKDEIGEVDVHLTFAPPWDPATMASEDVQFELGIF